MALAHLDFFSESLGLSTAMRVILPDRPAEPERGTFPVLYLLHGWSDNETTWCRRTSLERYLTGRDLLVVMPRGDLSYYQNTASGLRYWDFLSGELPQLVRRWFPVSTRREDTFAAGLSMGGYGAFRLALTHPERFAGAASLSGALDVRTCVRETLRRGREARLDGIFGEDLKHLDPAADLFTLADRVAAMPPAERPRLYQWCGTGDFLHPMNLHFRDHAREKGLPLTYADGPGDHQWSHWDREIVPVLEWIQTLRA
jgi:putative tributyrin esterase